MKESLESFKNNVRVGVLGLNMGEKAGKDLRVSVEEENLNPELLSHLLPGPALLAAHVREGRVEKEGGGGLRGGSRDDGR